MLFPKLTQVTLKHDMNVTVTNTKKENWGNLQRKETP